MNDLHDGYYLLLDAFDASHYMRFVIAGLVLGLQGAAPSTTRTVTPTVRRGLISPPDALYFGAEARSASPTVTLSCLPALTVVPPV